MNPLCHTASRRLPALRRAAVAAWLALAGGCALFDHVEPTILTQGEERNFIPEIPWVPSDMEVVDAMIDLAQVRKSDVVYDLGCGDGRVVIAAAKRGARGTGIDIDPYPLNFARRAARDARVEDRVRFLRGDIFEADLREATVVMLYMSVELNRRLLPKLLAELAPGARIVSHKFDMGDAWPPQRTRRVGDTTIYLWSVPERPAR